MIDDRCAHTHICVQSIQGIQFFPNRGVLWLVGVADGGHLRPTPSFSILYISVHLAMSGVCNGNWYRLRRGDKLWLNVTFRLLPLAVCVWPQNRPITTTTTQSMSFMISARILPPHLHQNGSLVSKHVITVALVSITRVKSTNSFLYKL